MIESDAALRALAEAEQAAKRPRSETERVYAPTPARQALARACDVNTILSLLDRLERAERVAEFARHTDTCASHKTSLWCSCGLDAARSAP